MAMAQVQGNDDLLISILVCLPPKSVFKFRSVSKRWKNIIAEPFFLESYSLRTRNKQLCWGGGDGGRLLAIIQERESSRYPPRLWMKILPVTHMNDYDIKQVPGRFGHLISSSNGLILCGKFQKTFHVVNPLTETWVSLPPLNIPNLSKFGFACEENTEELIASFKVVGIVMTLGESTTMMIETYSSKTRDWTTSTLIGTENFIVDEFLEPVVSNGVFHWPTVKHRLAIYDSNNDENYVELIKLPQDSELDFTLTYKRKDFVLSRSSSNDVIWVGIRNTEIIKFWMLPNVAAKEWVLMHTVDIHSLRNDVKLLLENKKRKKCGGVNTVANYMSYGSFCFEGVITLNPMVVVLSLRQEVFIYNLESKSIKLVQYRGRPIAEGSTCGWHPYVESLSLSSYALSANTYC